MTETQKKKELSKLVKKNEFWVGLATVGIVFFILAGAFKGFKTNKIQSQNANVTSEPTITVTQGQLSEQAVQTSAISQVTRLADTAGAYIVEEGDNFYTITVKVCGKGTYYRFVAEQNDNKPLHAGTLVTVDCVE